MQTRTFRRSFGAVVVLSVLTSMTVDAGVGAESGAELASGTLASINGLSPQDYGAATVDGPEYADPTEALSIIDPPEPNADGSVDLAYPLGVPPGHGITPELTLQYGSGGGNGWMGEGWDFGVGEITVDTSFGAPHFSQQSESESYLLDGALLTPNANDDAWEPRAVGARHDFARQVETEYDEIIRHQVGSGWPADYFWEVRSKDGSVKWYGGTPDSGGPVPSATDAPTIDERAVVRNDAGHIVKWLLSAQRDIGVNLIRYEYTTLTYQFNGTTWQVDPGCSNASSLCGRHTYLDRILYTDATSGIADRNGPPYEIDIIRQSEPGLGGGAGAVRSDPVVDASLGYVDVVVDRLGRVEVKHGAASASGTTRTYDQIAARYDFGYRTGRFGKTQLETITQGVDDPHVHRIDYYDDLSGTDSIEGFDPAVEWESEDDVPERTYLDATSDVSTLGGAETNGGSGNLFIGFNPFTPSKTLSVGLGLELSGSDSDAIAEWIDLNGDNLPDKVFLQDGDLKFRLNDSGPRGAAVWDRKETVKDLTDPANPQSINQLSKNSSFAFQVSAEAYPLVALGIGTGLSFSWSNTYFADVNGDGLIDFVRNGQVYFNTLNDDDVLTFTTSSANTPIPLAPSLLPDVSSERLAALSDTLALQSPPIDTVRRFMVPFTGTVSIAAPVTLSDPGLDTTDGVRVAIQRDGTEIASRTLTTAAPTAFADPLGLPVTAGDEIYFRVGAIDDGANDVVTWAPVVTYDAPTWPTTDANGLSQVTWSAEEDFTLAGRPNDFIAMPNAGVARVVADVALTAPLSDAVSVKRDAADNETVTVLGTIEAGEAGPLSVGEDIPVAITDVVDPDDPDNVTPVPDKLSVYLATDSQVDLADIAFTSTIGYTSAVDADGNPIHVLDRDGQPKFEHHVRPHVEIYPYADPAVPAEPTSLSGSQDVLLTVQAPAGSVDGIPTVKAVITVKSPSGLLEKVETDLAVSGDGTASTPSPVTIDIPAGAGERWIDVSIRDAVFSRGGLALSKLVTVAGTVETPIEHATLRWSGMQGIFAQPYRGWAIAGYTAGSDLGGRAMSESAFTIDPDSYSRDQPTRADASLDDPHTEPSYAFVPVVSPGGGSTAQSVSTPRWVGPRANLYADATTVRTSRLAVDSVDFSSITSAPNGAGTRSAPTRLSLTGPGLTLSFGAGPLGASAGLSPSFGLIDYEDMNGDGYPDVVSTGNVSYTDQLGAYLPSAPVGRTSVTNQDLTISINGGLSAGMVDINANVKGSTNSVTGDASSKASSASDSGASFSLGISGSGGYSWSSPNASGGSGDPGEGTYEEQVSSLQSDYGADTSEIQRALADINGDGLPDSVYTNASGTFAYYNLGYGFAGHAIKLGGGGFESRESAVGGAGVGFSLPYGEFGGGVNFLWNYDWSTYSWKDVNGDGILDQLRRLSADQITVRFGTGSGLLAPIDYGDLARVPVSPGIDGGQHISFDRSSGIGTGVSATAYIGPLCLVACYLILGGGAGFNNSLSSSNVDLEDVDGDGFADALLSLDDNLLSVSRNRQGRTNLLKSVTNPLGGSFTVDYDRAGNTVDHPDSIWVMKHIDIDDGRSEPTATTTGRSASTIEYSGLDYDRTAGRSASTPSP